MCVIESTSRNQEIDKREDDKNDHEIPQKRHDFLSLLISISKESDRYDHRSEQGEAREDEIHSRKKSCWDGEG